MLDRLLAADIEQRLAEGSSGQIPLAKDVSMTSRAVPGPLKIMEVDFESAADRWDRVAKVLTDIFPLGQ